jgi:hypothetical protein
MAAAFGGYPLPLLGRSGEYQRAVVFAVLPILCSLAVLGAIRSRAARWERGSTRHLAAGRLCVNLGGGVACLVAAAPAAIQHPINHALALSVQSSCACVGVGLLVAIFADYELQVSIVTLYGISSLMFGLGSDGTWSYLLLAGIAPSWHGTAMALTVFAVASVCHAVGTQRD